MFPLFGPVAMYHFRCCEIFFSINVVCRNSRTLRSRARRFAHTQLHFSSQKPRNSIFSCDCFDQVAQQVGGSLGVPGCAFGGQPYFYYKLAFESGSKASTFLRTQLIYVFVFRSPRLVGWLKN